MTWFGSGSTVGSHCTQQNTQHKLQRKWENLYSPTDMHPCASSISDNHIKVDRPLTRDTLNAPWLLTNRHFNGLVMVIRNYHWLNSASRVLISTCSAPVVQRESVNKHILFNVDLWPTTLTYNPRLAKVKVDPHTKNQGQKSNRRATIDKWMDTHTRTLSNVLSPLLCGR